jgi:hypothetical protein
MSVFVLAQKQKPLMPCTEKQARIQLESCRARVHSMYPFTIRLVDRKSDDTQPLILKVDPGSTQTGLAIVREDEAKATTIVVALVEHKHRSAEIWDLVQPPRRPESHRFPAAT